MFIDVRWTTVLEIEQSFVQAAHSISFLRISSRMKAVSDRSSCQESTCRFEVLGRNTVLHRYRFVALDGTVYKASR